MKKLICFAAALAAGMFLLLSHATAQTGSASWYALDGRMTANGERMNSRRMTAAHRRLPFGTRIRVTNLRNGKSVVVRINDRGPFAKGRVLDVSKAAARRLGFLGRGHTRVKISVLGRSKKRHARSRRKKRSAFLAPVTIPTHRPAITLVSLGFSNYY
ncbi:MAG: septal ring lytic transglycosylase RlpA family protein [Rhizobiaceae bacterium]